MIRQNIPCSLGGIGEGLDFIESTLMAHKFKRHTVQEAMLLSEECMVHLTESAPADAEMQISIRRTVGLDSITLSAPGQEITLTHEDPDINLEESDLGRENESAIRDILLRSYADKVRYARKSDYNYYKVTAGYPERVSARRTLFALIAALALGSLLLLLPENVQNSLDTYLLLPVQTLFLNCLRLLTAPAVFFSILTSVARYSSFSDPGRVSVRVVMGYVFTSVMAVFVGICAFRLLQPGTMGQLSGFVSMQQSIVDGGSGTIHSFSDLITTVVNIVPANIIDPFLNMDTLQLIFLALICGVALGRIGDYSKPLKDAVTALDTLCSKVAEIVLHIVPYAGFFATVSLLFNMGLGALLSLAQMVGTLLVGLAAMMVVYILLVTVPGRLNPIHFLRKYAPYMWQTLLLGSGLNAMPKTIRCCKNRLGISPKVYSFSVPFGATVNMDGNCVYLSIAGLFLARLCGVELFSSELVPFIFSVVILSIGAPISSGTVLLCMSVLLSQMNISVSAISILLGVNALLEMVLGMSNTVGDVAISLVVARTEKLLDTDLYRRK